MRLRQITLKGFKSFKNLTTFPVGDGINCVVGPNGCGKSNIVDALLWVMGEGALSSLRGKRSEDLIFAGTLEKNSTGSAEVSLLLERTSGLDFPSPFQNCMEVHIVRRVDRDGKSNCFINSEPCRLKDIQEFFMDTGVGAGGFAVIEQGTIESIVSSKPREKKALLEAVSGVARFRSRKLMAEKKLGKAKESIQRLKTELQRQSEEAGKLKRQAGKAGKYKTLKEAIRNKDIQNHRYLLSGLRQKGEGLTKKIEEKEGLLKTLEQEAAGLDNAHRDLQDQLSALEKHIQHKESSLNRKKELRVSLEKNLASLQANLKATSGFSDQNTEDARALKSNAKELAYMIDEVSGKITKQNEQIVQKTEEVSLLETGFQEKQKELDFVSKEIDRMRLNVLSLEQKQLSFKEFNHFSMEKAAELKSRILEEQEKYKRVFNELEDLKEEKKKCLLKTKKEENTFSKLEQDIQGLYKTIEHQKALERQAGEVLFKLHAQILSLRLGQDAQKVGAKIQGAKKAAKDYVFSSPVWKNRVSVVKEHVDFPKHVPCKNLFAYYFSDKMEALRLKDESRVLQLVEEVRARKKGLCHFVLDIGLDKGEGGKPEPGGLKTEEGFCYFLKEKMQGEFARDLVKDVVVVAGLAQAIRLKKKYLGSWCFFSEKGDGFVFADGEMVAGEMELFDGVKTESLKDGQTRDGESPGSLMFLKKQRDAQLKKKEDISACIQESFREVNKAVEKKGRSEALHLAGRKEQEKLEANEVHLQKEVKLCLKEIKKLKAESERKKTREQVWGEDKDLELRDLKSKISDFNSKKSEFMKEVEVLFSRKKTASLELTELEKELHALNEKQKWQNQILEKEKKKEADLIFRTKEKQQLIQGYKEEHKKMLDEKMRLDMDVEKEDRGFQDTVKQHKEKGLEAHALQETRIQCHQQKSETQTSLHTLQNDRQVCLEKQREIEKYIMENYQVDMENLVNRERENEDAGPVEFDAEKEEEALRQLKQKLERIGEVNLLALQELKEKEERIKFYETQYEDLNRSRDSLKHLIEYMDQFCSKRFRLVFNQVNDLFSKVFASIFEGGVGRLSLVECKRVGKEMYGEDDPGDEEGVEVIVQPPGKKLQNMNLLSGGEKSMTALALVFSFLLVRPSAFCVLDEVDAALDDANIIRFNLLLKEMSKISQAIVITHNKHTMRGAGHLFGVTMEEKGISKLLTVSNKQSVKKDHKEFKEDLTI